MKIEKFFQVNIGKQISKHTSFPIFKGIELHHETVTVYIKLDLKKHKPHPEYHLIDINWTFSASQYFQAVLGIHYRD